MSEFFDTHAHLDYDDYKSDFAEMLTRAQAAGITRLISIATDLASSRRALALAEQYPQIYAAVGWHPSNAHEAPADIRAELRELARHPKAVAIGECGLDYYRLPSTQGGTPADDIVYKKKQAEIFEQQLEIAVETGLNCVIHQRSSFDDLFAQIQPYAVRTRGVYHCFGESVERLQKILGLGWYVSYTGIVTFKNAQAVHEVATNTPLERLLIETDSPYLAPVPHRGKLNDPAKVVHVAEKIADLKGLPVAQIAQQTSENFFKLFNKINK